MRRLPKLISPRPPRGGGGVSEPPKVFCNNFLTTKNDIEMKFWLIVNGLINKSVDFYEIEHCPYMREGEGSYFRDI